MESEYVWLPKNDPLIKEYVKKNWNVGLIAKILSNETYYCLSKRGGVINETLKTKLLCPLCLIEKQYKNCLIIFEEDSRFGFIWIDKKCFSVSGQMLDDFVSSTMDFFRVDDQYKIKKAKKLLDSSKITVKSAVRILPILSVILLFLTVVVVGFYLWLY